MTSSGTRTLAVLLVLACVGAQPGAGSALLAGALTFGLHESHHAHARSLISDEGHVHLVLSHEDSGGAHRREAPLHPDASASPSESDHVLCIAGDDAANATSRRVARGSTPSLAIAVVLPFAPVTARGFRPCPTPQARSSNHLRTIVLRL